MSDIEVKCPGCGGRSLYGPGNPWRPFCSERCRSADLGAWATERYRMASGSSADDAEDDDTSAPPASR